MNTCKVLLHMSDSDIKPSVFWLTISVHIEISNRIGLILQSMVDGLLTGRSRSWILKTPSSFTSSPGQKTECQACHLSAWKWRHICAWLICPIKYAWRSSMDYGVHFFWSVVTCSYWKSHHLLLKCQWNSRKPLENRIMFFFSFTSRCSRIKIIKLSLL